MIIYNNKKITESLIEKLEERYVNREFIDLCRKSHKFYEENIDLIIDSTRKFNKKEWLFINEVFRQVTGHFIGAKSIIENIFNNKEKF